MSKYGLALAFTVAAVPALAQSVPAYKAGFPLTLPGQGTVQGKPALADVRIPGDTVGVKSIVFGTLSGNLHVIHRTSATTWANAPGFPVAVGAPIRSSPAVADLTGDGIPEIVIGFGEAFGSFSATGGVKAFRNNGTVLWTRTSGDRNGPAGGADGLPDAVVGTPAIGDVDADGQNDVVWGATDFKVYFVNGSTGANKPNWPRDVLDSVLSSPVLHDMDGDNRPEIIVGVDAHLEPNPAFGGGTPEGGCLHVIPGVQPVIPATFPGSVGYPQNLPGFPKCINQVIFADPVVGDIDGDGRPEIVHGTGTFYQGRTRAAYAWKCDGTAAAGWPVALSGETLYGTSLALANLDADLALEVVLTVDNVTVPATTRDPRVYAINGNGVVMPGFPKGPLNFFGTNPPLNAGSPLVADVLGDTALEILVPTNTEITAFSLAGTQLTEDGTVPTNSPSFYTQTSLFSVAVGDLDPGDNRIEVVAVSATPFPTATDTQIHVWNPVLRTSTPPWGQYRHNERRTGVAPGTGPCRTYGVCPAPPTTLRFHTVNPCRVVDTRGASGVPIGGPALAAGGFRDFDLRNRCGVPATADALSLNITVVSPTGAGNVRFAPSCLLGGSSTINFGPGQIRANNAVLLIGAADGVLTANAAVTGNGTVHLLIDVNGYFE